MVNIVIPEGRSSGTIDVDSGQMNITTGGQHPYSMQQLADNNGLTDAMNQMNYESRMYDDQLHEENLSNDQDFSDEMDDSSEHHQNTEMQEYDQEQTEHRPRQRRKKSKDKRFDDLTRNYHLEREQREEYEKEVKRLRDDNARIKILEDEHAAMVLKLEQKEINDNLKKVSNIMIQAKEEDDNATYVKANLLMNKLSLKEAENERAYSQIQDRYNQYQQDVPDDDREQEVMQQLIKRADPRDLKSEYFNDFLNDHPYADARNLDEFDPDLADEFFSHKKKFDKALKLERRSNYIGTADYYDELNDVIKDEMHSKSYRRNKTQNRRQNQYQDEPSFDDDDDYNYEEDKMKKWKYAISSMTQEEKENPEILEKQTSRISRIAKGSGTNTTDIRQMIKQFKMIKEFASGASDLQNIDMNNLSDPAKLMSNKQLMKMVKKLGKKKMMRFMKNALPLRPRRDSG